MTLRHVGKIWRDYRLGLKAMSNESTLINKGAFAYENWKDALANEPLKGITEYPLFTDATIRGHLKGDYGPYQLLNTLPKLDTGLLAPHIVLRIDYHAKYD